MNLFKKEDSKVYIHKVPTRETGADGKPVYDEISVEVSWKIPPAPEAETILVEQTRDTVVFKKYVQEVKSNDVDGWSDGVSAADVVATPGTAGLIHSVVMDIIAGMRLGFTRKN